jgi:hypothetical protein
MPNVEIRGVGTMVPFGAVDQWTFDASVDDQAGVIVVDVERGATGERARAVAKHTLEERPSALEGVLSTGGGGGRVRDDGDIWKIETPDGT